MACDASVVALLEKGGEPLSAGRRRRTIPPAIARALKVRDQGCAFPGCPETRFVQAHHIVHWANGGETSMANLSLLCSFHHHLVHEGGFGLVREPTSGELVFSRPGGAAVPAYRIAPGPFEGRLQLPSTCPRP